MKTSWEQIRANWVNGNLRETRAIMRALPRKDLWYVLRDAAWDINANLDHTPGSLSDLHEILNSLVKCPNKGE